MSGLALAASPLPRASAPHAPSSAPAPAAPLLRALPSLLRVRETRPSYGDSATPDIPDPFEDADALEALGEEIATLAARNTVGEQKMLELIADFDRRRGWELGGHRSCAYWLAYRTKMDLHTARERVRAAKVLAGLPETNAAMARGELSFSSVRALTRVATPENEEDLLELARGCTTAQLERVVRAFRIGGAKDEAARERVMHQARSLSVFPGDDGMYVVKGRLTPEVGALLMRAIEAASDALYRERHVPGTRAKDTARAARRLRADALGLLAERALGVGFGGALQGATGGAPETDDDVPAGTPGADSPSPGGVGGAGGAGGHGGRRGADDPGSGTDEDVPAGTSGANSPSSGGADSRPSETGKDVPAGTPATAPAPISGTRAERYQVMLHVEPGTLCGDGCGDGSDDGCGAGSGAGRSHLHDGTRIAAETSRRIACDAAVVRVDHGTDGGILNVGRRTRSIPPALRRALEVRDRGCRFPGCGLGFTDAHHLIHWADGGETSLANTLLLCGHHHRLVHEGGWQLQWWGEGRPVFFDPRGGAHYDGRWQPPELTAREIEALAAREAEALTAREAETLTGPKAEALADEGPDGPGASGPRAASPRADGPDRGPDGGVDDGLDDAPDGWTASARWKLEEDIPDDVLFRAMEALGD